MTMSFERSDQTTNGSAQPKKLASSCGRVVRNASGFQDPDALRAWVRDNVPNRALRLSIHRHRFWVLLDRRFCGHRGEVPERPIATRGEDSSSRSLKGATGQSDLGGSESTFVGVSRERQLARITEDVSALNYLASVNWSTCGYASRNRFAQPSGP